MNVTRSLRRVAVSNTWDHMKRNVEIDTLRGIACILLVAYHVIGSEASQGLRISSGFYREVNDLLAYIRMPLFTFLSGVVYAQRPFSGDLLPFLRGKARRLLLPMLTVGTIFAISQYLVPGTNGSIQDWSTLHLKPVAHFWFVESLFIIFLVVVLLEHWELLRSPVQGVLALMGASAIYLTDFYLEWFSISGAIYLAPYFLAGLFVRRHCYEIRWSGRVGQALLIWSFLLMGLVYSEFLPQESRRSLLGLLIGLPFCIGALYLGLRSTVLAEIGAYSYAIYLFHVFFTAGSRIALSKVGVLNVPLLLFVGTCAGVVMPALLEVAMKRSEIAGLLFLGKKVRR